jgi:hypothetical protein
MRHTAPAKCADAQANWEAELAGASRAGVRIFGVCTDGSDLLAFPRGAVLTNHTRSMIERVVGAVPGALVIPRVPIGAFIGAGAPATLEHAQLHASATSLPGKPAGTVLPSPYGSMTAAWANASAGRLGVFLKLLDAAFPGRIAGVHLAGLAAGEMRWEQPPESAGYSDYSASFLAEFLNSSGGGGAPPATADDRCSPPDGNIFVDSASAALNLYVSKAVQRAISANARAAKMVMEGKGLVLSFYGYLNELGGHRASGSGHLALHQLMADPNIDAIVSPYKYALNQFRKPTGTFATMGPADSAWLHGKLWVSEDDTRTSFACGWVRPPYHPPATQQARAGTRAISGRALAGGVAGGDELMAGGWRAGKVSTRAWDAVTPRRAG